MKHELLDKKMKRRKIYVSVKKMEREKNYDKG
jgi:hypothetical protein